VEGAGEGGTAMSRRIIKGEPKVLTAEQVAERLGIGAQSVRDLIDEGKLHAIDVGGGSRKFWRIPVTSIERFERERSSV